MKHRLAIVCLSALLISCFELDFDSDSCESLCESGECPHYMRSSASGENDIQSCIQSCNEEFNDSDIEADRAGYCSSDV